MVNSVSRSCMVIGLACVLSACQSSFFASKKPQSAPEPAPVVQPKPVVQDSQAARLLILNGEYTLAQDQLLTPANDNAYDYFRAALKLNPDSSRAKGGIQGIVIRYVDLARQAAARGNYPQATTMLNNARIVDPGNLLIKEVSAGLTEQIKSAPPIEPYRGRPNEFLLDASLLGKDDPKIIARINEIAQKLKSTNSLAMIIARTDVEGRWIYQKLRDAVPGYRVRGDIKLGSPARVQLVPVVQ
jgi:hypothetical protein